MTNAQEFEPPSGDWWLHTIPFRHLRAENVLNSAEYERVARAFVKTLEAGKTTGLKKNANYDANIVGLNHGLAQLFAPFFSKSWVEAMHRVVSLPNLERVDGALHSSDPGSRTGWIHTDLCSGWFDESGDTT